MQGDANMKWKIIDKEDFIVTKWTGGETTQLFIYPEDAIFSEKISCGEFHQLHLLLQNQDSQILPAIKDIYSP